MRTAGCMTSAGKKNCEQSISSLRQQTARQVRNAECVCLSFARNPSFSLDEAVSAMKYCAPFHAMDALIGRHSEFSGRSRFVEYKKVSRRFAASRLKRDGEVLLHVRDHQDGR